MNRPGRTDHYIMLAAMEACRSRLKDPSRVKLSDFLIRFEEPRPPPDPSELPEGFPRPATREQVERVNRERLLRRRGIKSG